MTDDTMGFDIESTLAQLADMDVSGIDEIRSEKLPVGTYAFRVVAAEGPKEAKPDKDENPRAEVLFELEVVEVEKLLKNDGPTPESLIGKKQTERNFITLNSDAEKGIGRIRAFIADIGCNNVGKLGDIITATTGHVFKAGVIHSPDKNDKNVSYARLKLAPAKKAAAVADV